MTILSDKTITEYLEDGSLVIKGLSDNKQIQPSSVDLRLSNEFKVFKTNKKEYINPRLDTIDDFMEQVIIDDDEAFIIHPNEFALATTSEYVEIPDDLVARVEGRSSIGRLGVTMHVTAGFIDPGFKGKITLEISNIGALPVALYPGQRVCQIVFEEMTTSAMVPYGHPDRNSKYMMQDSPVVSKVKYDYEWKKIGG